MKKYQSILLASIAIGLASCEPDFENPISDGTYSNGDANFTTYVAIGNSLTAGYMDGSMFKSGQANSFPNILAGQLKYAGGGEFTQPSFADDVNNLGGLTLGGNPLPNFPTRLAILMQGGAGSPVNLAGQSTIDVTSLQQKAYNNMGVPGAKSFHLLAQGYGSLAGLQNGTANPYFVRHATSSSATVLGDAMSLNPTFFTNWIGSNDVLAYAMSGGTGVNQLGNTDVATYGSNDITDPQAFAFVYSTIINTLTSNGAKGVVATIPDVASVPYFRTVPFNPLTAQALGGDANVDALNTQLFGVLKAVLGNFQQEGRINLLSKTSANALLIKDESLTDLSAQITAAASQNPQLAPLAPILGYLYGQARHATAADLFTLPTSSLIGKPVTDPVLQQLPEPYASLLNKNGVTYPLGDANVLIPTEQREIVEATRAFNQVIRGIAAQKNLAVADMNKIMNDLVSGLYSEDGQKYTSNYFQGLGNLNTVMFSLDGVHPNARGYAFVANEVIKVINAHYKSNVPNVYVGKYAGPTIITSN